MYLALRPKLKSVRDKIKIIIQQAQCSVFETGSKNRKTRKRSNKNVLHH